MHSRTQRITKLFFYYAISLLSSEQSVCICFVLRVNRINFFISISKQINLGTIHFNLFVSFVWIFQQIFYRKLKFSKKMISNNYWKKLLSSNTVTNFIYLKKIWNGSCQLELNPTPPTQWNTIINFGTISRKTRNIFECCSIWSSEQYAGFREIGPKNLIKQKQDTSLQSECNINVNSSSSKCIENASKDTTLELSCFF